MGYRMKILFAFLVFATVFTTGCYAQEVIYAKTEQKSDNTFVQKPEPDPGIELKNPFIKKESAPQPPQEEKISQLNIDSEEMEYIEERNEVEARGNVVVSSLQEDATITSDRAVFNKDTNIIKFYDNVTLKKGGSTIIGNYMVVDLNEENVLLDEPIGQFSTFKITAKEGHAYANKIEAINGNMELAKEMELKLASSGFGSYDDTIVQEHLATSEIRKKRSEPLRIETSEILIKSHKDHDSVTLKNASIYYKKFKLGTVYEAQIHTDKAQSFVETNVPEFGSIPDFGTYIGLGYVQQLPNSTLKLVPSVIIKDSKAGFGGIARFRSKRNYIEGGWGSSSENLLLRGRYTFTDNLKLEYSRHMYMDEWFLGGRRPGYLAQLVHHKSWHNEDLGAKFSQRLTGGYVEEYSKDHQEDMSGTMRLRWQAELEKILYNIGDREQDTYLQLHAVTQAGATLYGKGDVTGIVRVGPGVYSRVKNWGSRINFFMSGVHGLSPYRFDEYRYGKVSISFDENIRLGRYLAVGYKGTISPLKDNYKDEFMTENRFYVMAGPEDFKVAVSHDTVRSMTRMDFLFFFGSDTFRTNFKKLIMDDPATIGKEKDVKDEINYYRLKVPAEEI